MIIKSIKYNDVLAWLESMGITVKSVRRVSARCTNIYLSDGGVLCHYDTETLDLQGNPPTETIRHFLALKELKETLRHTDFGNSDDFDSPNFPDGDDVQERPIKPKGRQIRPNDLDW